MKVTLSCACGDREFAVRLHRNEAVGLVTCVASGHPSLLLDSRDHWFDIIQDARPPVSRCRCGGRAFEVSLAYTFREEGKVVRHVDVLLRCIACENERTPMSIDIDYEPTEMLVERPLDPCAEPWLVARSTSLSAYWKQADVSRVVRYLCAEPDVRCYFAAWRERPRLVGVDEACIAVKKAQVFDIFFAPRDLVFPERLRDAWRTLPVIHFSTPTKMIEEAGAATLYEVHWAREVFIDGRIAPHDAELLALADRTRTWLATQFISLRGENTYDNPGEYERIYRPETKARFAARHAARAKSKQRTAKRRPPTRKM